MFRPPQKCANCRFYRQHDPDDEDGECTWQPVRAPFWFAPPRSPLFLTPDSGTDCEAHMYDKHRPHPLDQARAFLAQRQVGDLIGMRTYGRGSISRQSAKVLRHTKNFVVIELFNRHVRVRYDDTTRGERGGTVMELPDWGVDFHAQVVPATARAEHPERALNLLRGIKVGDEVPLIGYPPMDGMRRMARVTQVYANKLKIRIGKRKALMYRRGTLAGIIEGDVWTLDTTDHASETQTATQREAPAQGHVQG